MKGSQRPRAGRAAKRPTVPARRRLADRHGASAAAGRKLPAAPPPRDSGFRLPKYFAKGLAYAGVEAGTELEDRYRALCGAPSQGVASASNRTELEIVARDLVPGVLDALRGVEEAQCGFVLLTYGTLVRTPFERDIPIDGARKLKRQIEKVSPNSLAGVRIFPWPTPENPDAFKIVTEVGIIIFGSNIRDGAERAVEEIRRREAPALPGRPSAKVTWLDQISEDAVGDLARKILPQGTPRAREAGVAASELGVDGWAGKRGQRAYYLLQTLSQVPISKMLFGTGDGAPLVGAALLNSAHRAKTASRTVAPLIHKDAVVHFLSEEMMRLGQGSFPLPFPRLR